MIAKVLHREGREQQCRFLVTSLDWNSPHVTEAMRDARAIPAETDRREPKDFLPRVLYESLHCPRGDLENRIREYQLDLFGHRASGHAFSTNQTRLILAGFAYVLMTQLRLRALQGTDLAKAMPNTIREKPLKIDGRITTSMRRIKIAMPGACPTRGTFCTTWERLALP